MTRSANSRWSSAIGNGSATNFPLSFPVENTGQLKVYADDVLVTTGYVVTGNTVIFAVAPVSGVDLLFVGDTDIVQLYDGNPLQRVQTEAIEEQLDRLTQVAQETDVIIRHSLTVGWGQTPPTVDIDEFSPSDTLIIGPGNTIVPGPTADQIAAAESFAVAAQAARDGAETAEDGAQSARDEAVAAAAAFLTANLATCGTLGVQVGAVSIAVALENANKINAWLALADGNVFDMQNNLVGVAATIRLGRHGNGVIGTSAAQVFGAAPSGARFLWQGASGGTVVLCRRSINSEDLNAPRLEGFSVDGNALAQVGIEYSGVSKPRGHALHVANLLDNVSSYGFIFRHNPSATGGVNCCYGGNFGALTVVVTGSANGLLFAGLPGGAGTATTFCTFDYIHVTCRNGYSLVFAKGDDNVFHQIGVSRQAGGTNGAVLFSTNAAALFVWVGNVIHNMNLSKTDGATMQIIVNDNRTFGNFTRFNGVDFTPTVVYLGGSKESDNDWHFIGQTDYAGGWINRPYRTFYLKNADNTDPRVLDWYEEGTFTPVIQFTGANVGQAYAIQTGTWTRIGNRVHVQVDVSFSGAVGARGTSTGDMTITGLPFTSLQVGGGANFGFWAGLASGVSPVGQAAGGVVTMRKQSGGGLTAMTHADCTDSTRLSFQLTYRVA